MGDGKSVCRTNQEGVKSPGGRAEKAKGSSPGIAGRWRGLIGSLIIKILFRKDVEEMAVVYATLIIKGKKSFADVPERIKDQVRDVLVSLDCPELAE